MSDTSETQHAFNTIPPVPDLYTNMQQYANLQKMHNEISANASNVVVLQNQLSTFATMRDYETRMTAFEALLTEQFDAKMEEVKQDMRKEHTTLMGKQQRQHAEELSNLREENEALLDEAKAETKKVLKTATDAVMVKCSALVLEGKTESIEYTTQSLEAAAKISLKATDLAAKTQASELEAMNEKFEAMDQKFESRFRAREMRRW